MTVSAVPAFIDALVATLTAAFPSTVLVAGFPVQVFDGVGSTSQDTGRQVWVGVTDVDDDQVAESATADQTWPYASNTFRREELAVHLIAQAWTGDSSQASVKTMRDAAYAIVNAVTSAIVADPDLGGAVLMVRQPAGQMTLRQTQDDKGSLARVVFDVTAMAQFQG